MILKLITQVSSFLKEKHGGLFGAKEARVILKKLLEVMYANTDLKKRCFQHSLMQVSFT